MFAAPERSEEAYRENIGVTIPPLPPKFNVIEVRMIFKRKLYHTTSLP